MLVGVLKESYPGERRVALVPPVLASLAKAGIKVCFESGAGLEAGWSDAAYADKGAELASRAEVLGRCDVLAQVRGLGANPEVGRMDLGSLRAGQVVVGMLDPLNAPQAARELAATGVTAFALELLPRITRAQSMDVLSSMATISGYKAVVLAAATHVRLFPMLMTAAGTITPSRVLVMGTGVAGLQAIGTAKRLGAVVEATDVRPETKEQVESLGGRFLQVTGVEVKAGQGGYAAEQSEEYKKKQAEMISSAIARADIVITTALIPGRKAPRLVSDAQVKSMRPGSVIVDLAAEQGGNVEGCEGGREVVQHGVTIVGFGNFPSFVAVHASQMLSKNVEKLLLHLTADGAWKINMDEEITKGCVITREGEIVHPKVKESAGGR